MGEHDCVPGHEPRRKRVMMHRRKQQLTLGDAIKVVARFSHDDHEIVLVVADLINRGLIRLQVPCKHARVVRTNR
jgi:hypothetical protein